MNLLAQRIREAQKGGRGSPGYNLVRMVDIHMKCTRSADSLAADLVGALRWLGDALGAQDLAELIVKTGEFYTDSAVLEILQFAAAGGQPSTQMWADAALEVATDMLLAVATAGVGVGVGRFTTWFAHEAARRRAGEIVERALRSSNPGQPEAYYSALRQSILDQAEVRAGAVVRRGDALRLTGRPVDYSKLGREEASRMRLDARRRREVQQLEEEMTAGGSRRDQVLDDVLEQAGDGSSIAAPASPRPPAGRSAGPEPGGPGTPPVSGGKRSGGTGRQTGGRGGEHASPDDAWAAKRYDEIRSDPGDVDRIAGATGIRPENIQKVKKHVFEDVHVKDRFVDQGVPPEVGRFDPDPEQVRIWERLQSGRHTQDDIAWLKHEIAERKQMEIFGSRSYGSAHDTVKGRWPSPLEK